MSLKHSFLFFMLFLVATYSSTGQDSSAVLANSWLKLNTQLQRRTDIAINMASFIKEKGKANNAIAEQVKSTARELSLFIDSVKHFDSITVQSTWQKNQHLTEALSKVITVIINDSKLSSKEELRNLQMHLEGSENRIIVAKRNYNEICMEHKRPDLFFGHKPETD